MCAAILNHAASQQQQQHSSGPYIQQQEEKRRKDKEKKLTVQPIRKTQEKPRHSLKKTLKFEIQPEHVLPLETQVAGHGTEDQNSARHRGLLLHQDGFVLKPVQAPPKGDRETDFYRRVSTSSHPTDMEIYSFMAKFYGIENVRGGMMFGECEQQQQPYLVLEDLTRGMRRPCVMDIKVGARTYGPDASPAKRQQEDSKYLGTKKPLGFSVLGIISREGRDGATCRRWDKTFGLKLATDQVSDLLHNFLNWREEVEEERGGEITARTAAAKLALARHFHARLAAMTEFFRHRQRSYHFYASSLLFVYDYDVVGRLADHHQAVIGCSEEEEEGSGGNSSAELLTDRARLKLIDFAHVFPAAAGSPDDNFLFGLENLRDIFQNFLLQNQTEGLLS